MRATFADATLSGTVTTELPLNTEVQVVQATERFAEVALVSPGVEPVAASGDVSPATPNAEPVETFFVEARGLQDTRQQGSELMRLAADAASEGKPGEQLELMTRAALLEGAPRATFEALFDAALAAGDFPRAAWAAQGKPMAEVFIWQTIHGAEAARRELERLDELVANFHPAFFVGTQLLDQRQVPGLGENTSLLVAGACSAGETLGAEARSLLSTLRPQGGWKRLILATGVLSPMLFCPSFGTTLGSNCDGDPPPWALAGSAEATASRPTHFSRRSRRSRLLERLTTMLNNHGWN